MCAMVCGPMFILDGDTGHASVATSIVPPVLEEAVLTAQASYSEQAIEIG